MKKHNVLLVCGSGASSGFMAANIRKAAAARGLSITVNARSESTVEDYVDEIDCLMIGPTSPLLCPIWRRSARVMMSRSASLSRLPTHA